MGKMNKTETETGRILKTLVRELSRKESGERQRFDSECFIGSASSSPAPKRPNVLIRQDRVSSVTDSEEESGDFEKNTLTRRSYKSATRKSQITKSTTEAISKSDPEISKQDPKPNADGHQNNNKSEKLPKRKESLLRKILPSFKPKSKKNKNDKNPEFHVLEMPQKSSKKS